MALRSMTACGRATLTNALGCFTVELQSLNRKQLDLTLQLPPELQCFEADIKKWISLVVSRGQLTFRLSAQFDSVLPVTIKPNIPFVRQMVAAWEAIAAEIGVPLAGDIKIKLLSGYEGAIIYENSALDDNAFRSALHNIVNMGLDKLTRMKMAEGQALQLDIAQRLTKLKELIGKIVINAPEAILRYRKKIEGRFKELLEGILDIDERILGEVGVYADRVDIAEEVARFRSHVVQFNDLLEGVPYDIGKTLEFLVQEMKREVNTIGSKSQDIDIAQLVIEMKTEVERIREQIQNVE